MSQWFNQDFLCTNPECELRFDSIVLRAERDRPTKCPECGSEAQPTVGSPAVLQRTLPDGTNRGAAWDRQKEIARLKMVRKQTRPEKRGDVEREIKKIQDKQLGKG